MRYLTFLLLKFLLLSNIVMAETIPTKLKILKQSSDCIKDSQTQVCKELISKIEKLQFFVFDQQIIWSHSLQHFHLYYFEV